MEQKNNAVIHGKTIMMPESNKLLAVADISQKIGEFLEWLSGEQGYILAEWDENGDKLFPINPDINMLLAEYFNIDMNKVEEERKELLRAIQRTHK
jgi:hypothetical protein